MTESSAWKTCMCNFHITYIICYRVKICWRRYFAMRFDRRRAVARYSIYVGRCNNNNNYCQLRARDKTARTLKTAHGQCENWTDIVYDNIILNCTTHAYADSRTRPANRRISRLIELPKLVWCRIYNTYL